MATDQSPATIGQKRIKFRNLRSITRISLWNKWNTELKKEDIPDKNTNSRMILFSSKPDLCTADSMLDMTRRFYSTLELEKLNNFTSSWEDGSNDMKSINVQIVKVTYNLKKNELRTGVSSLTAIIYILPKEGTHHEDFDYICAAEFIFNSVNGKNVIKCTVPWEEIWIRNVEDGLCFYNELITSGLLIGWATTSLMIKFLSSSDKNFWLDFMSKRRKCALSTFVASLPVKPTIGIKLEDGFTSISRKIAIDEYQTIKDIADNTFNKLNISKHDRQNFDIFVEYGQYRRNHLLLGYESPLSLLVHQTRVHRLNKSYASEFYEQNDYSNVNHLNCLLKRRKKTRSKSFSFDSRNSYQTDVTKTACRGDTLVRKFKRKMLNKRLSTENNQAATNQTNEKEPKSVQQGFFFGIPLEQLFHDGALLPESLKTILTVIYEKGSLTEGIFRKSPNIRQYKEARDALDANADICHFMSINPILCGSLLKEFLRLLPEPLFTYEILIKLKECYELFTDSPDVIQRVKKILSSHMTAASMTLLRHLIYLVRHVIDHENVNYMNLINLAICLSPCLLAKYQNFCSKDDTLCQSLIPILRILIDNYDSIFEVGIPGIFRRFHLNSIDEFNHECDRSDLESLKHSIESLNSVFDRGSRNLTTPPIVPFAVSKDSGLGGSRDLHQHDHGNFVVDDDYDSLPSEIVVQRQTTSDKLVRRVSSSLRRNSEHSASRTTSSNFRRQNHIRKSWLSRKSMTTKVNINVFGRRQKSSFKVEKNRSRFIDEFKDENSDPNANNLHAIRNGRSHSNFYGALFLDDQDEFEESYV